MMNHGQRRTLLEQDRKHSRYGRTSAFAIGTTSQSCNTYSWNGDFGFTAGNGVFGRVSSTQLRVSNSLNRILRATDKIILMG